MKNLELKCKLTPDSSTNNIAQYYVKDLIQTDVYFSSDTGKLKIRKEIDNSYTIYYERSNIPNEKISTYEFYPIDNYDAFMSVIGKCLCEEITVNKIRHLYIYKNARIHIDEVEELGNFLEIEVVIKTPEDDENAHNVMSELVELMNLNKYEKILIII